MCGEKRKEMGGKRVTYKMRPAGFYRAHNGFTGVTRRLERSRFPRLR